MATNYLIYPCKVMRITQSYTGETSHKPHTTGYPKDYPIDEGCSDSGRDYIYCPCNSMTIKRIYGVGTGGTNTIWLQSDEKVNFADGTSDYFTMLITHPNDSDLKRLFVGKCFKRKGAICREGNDGATANHFHISGGKGQYKETGWLKNSKGKWVLNTTGNAARPEDLFFIDTTFTKIIDKKNLAFINLGEKGNKYDVGFYRVTANLLNVRTGPSTKFKKKKFNELTISAQREIVNLTGGKQRDGYVKGLTFTVTEVNGDFGKTPSGWVSLRYCEEIK